MQHILSNIIISIAKIEVIEAREEAAGLIAPYNRYFTIEEGYSASRIK